jgi:hypothetical protein
MTKYDPVYTVRCECGFGAQELTMVSLSQAVAVTHTDSTSSTADFATRYSIRLATDTTRDLQTSEFLKFKSATHVY